LTPAGVVKLSPVCRWASRWAVSTRTDATRGRAAYVTLATSMQILATWLLTLPALSPVAWIECFDGPRAEPTDNMNVPFILIAELK
jgi:hypothetical protein